MKTATKDQSEKFNNLTGVAIDQILTSEIIRTIILTKPDKDRGGIDQQPLNVQRSSTECSESSQNYK